MSRNARQALYAIWGGAVIVIGAATFALHFWHPGGTALSLTGAHALCDSALGSFAQALSARTGVACGQIGSYYEVATWARWLAVIGAVAATIMIVSQDHTAPAVAR